MERLVFQCIYVSENANGIAVRVAPDLCLESLLQPTNRSTEVFTVFGNYSHIVL